MAKNEALFNGYSSEPFLKYSPTTTTISRGIAFMTMADTTIRAQKNLIAPKFYVSALNEAPSKCNLRRNNRRDTHYSRLYIYVCVSDDVWVRTEPNNLALIILYKRNAMKRKRSLYVRIRSLGSDRVLCISDF